MRDNVHLSRRKLLTGSVTAATLALAKRSFGTEARNPGSAASVRIAVDTRRGLGKIPDDFVGLGYEISSVSIPDLLSAHNRVYVQLVRRLGATGVIRIGGNTSDYASFAPTGEAVASPKGTVVNTASLRQLGTFLEATGWKLIWGLNLGSGDEQQAVQESEAVAAAVKDKLLAFEIGNEPDLFGRGTAHRPKGYSYGDYLKEYRRYKAAIRAKLPDAPFAGPDVAGATDWVTQFAHDEGNDLKLLTHHYYRECASPTATLDKLLHPDPKLAPTLEKLRAASRNSRTPYRICETNSFCGGGKPGVSDTFGAALWVLDFMFSLASAGCAGVNIETGVNQLDFISSYSPIGDDERGTYSAKPEYYGMLAFAQASQGRLVAVDYDTPGVNLTAYAVVQDRKRLSLTIINKDRAQDADVSVTTIGRFAHAVALRLIGPSLQSKVGITLAGAPVTASGDWKPEHREALENKSGQYEIRIPAASAAILQFQK
jgi:hypothetical protein